MSDQLLDKIVEALREPIISAVERVARETLQAARPEPPPVLLTVGDAARRMNVGATTVRRMIAAGELRGIRCLGSLRIDPRDLDALIADSGSGAGDGGGGADGDPE